MDKLSYALGLIINDVDCKKTEKPMPKLPTATNFWLPQPDLRTGAEAWILAGGAHHTAFTYDLTAEQMGDWAEAMGIEAYAKANKYGYVDYFSAMKDEKNGLPEKLSKDGVHPNGDGYKIMEKLVKEEIKKIVK